MKNRRNDNTLKSKLNDTAPENILLHDIRKLIEETRTSVATVVNAGLTILYWKVGKRINDDILHGKRASYGNKIVSTVSRQ
ncbi:MAG: hypothetical protein KAS17_11085, partial [Victivallaceae bacterium]|nr:hypothetical protein [Victivallaceae bacterium]